MRIFMFLVHLVFWLWIFIVPAGLLGVSAFLLYGRSADNLPYCIIISFAGIVSGAALAEHIRRRYGLSHFFGKLLSTPELEDGKG